MKKILLDCSIIINILGLSVCTVLETLRPSSLSIAVNLGVVWLVVVVLILAAFSFRQTISENTTR